MAEKRRLSEDEVTPVVVAKKAKTYVEEIKGDLLKEERCTYIAQQCNCIATKPHGLSKTIYTKLGLCPYVKRKQQEGRSNLAIARDRAKLGTILIDKVDEKKVKNRELHVVHMFAQYCYGKINPVMVFARDETPSSRFNAFKTCLRKMRLEIPDDAVVGFPKKIGSDLAGGNWEDYKRAIETEFAEPRGGNVLIVELEKKKFF